MNYAVEDEVKRSLYQIGHFLELGRYERARLIASNLISKYPNYYHGYDAMSICEFYLDDVDNAIELCVKSLEHGKDQKSASIMLMKYYNNKRDFINVDKQYNLIINLDPGCNDGNAIYGYSLCKRGRSEEGISILKEAFAINPASPTTLEYLLDASKQAKNKEEIYNLLGFYMNTNASHQRKLMFAGKSEASANEWEKSIKNFKDVLALDPSNKEALWYLKRIEKIKMRSFFIGTVLCIIEICLLGSKLIMEEANTYLQVIVIMFAITLISLIILFVRSLIKLRYYNNKILRTLNLQ